MTPPRWAQWSMVQRDGRLPRGLAGHVQEVPAAVVAAIFWMGEMCVLRDQPDFKTLRALTGASHEDVDAAVKALEAHNMIRRSGGTLNLVLTDAQRGVRGPVPDIQRPVPKPEPYRVEATVADAPDDVDVLLLAVDGVSEAVIVESYDGVTALRLRVAAVTSDGARLAGIAALGKAAPTATIVAVEAGLSPKYEERLAARR